MPGMAHGIPRTKTPVVMSWSGGKDSAVALYELRNSDEYEVVALLTSISQEYRRISHHGVREALLDQQAAAIGIPLEKVYLPAPNNQPCPNDVYEEIMGEAMAKFRARGVHTVGFGDLFLEDLRAWREANLAKGGMRGIFPLWKRDTAEFARELIRLGFKAFLAYVEGKLGPGFAGRAYNDDLLHDLPSGIDPCGEFGEFHSFVYDGPIFTRPVPVRVGEIIVRDGRFYADLLPEGVAVPVGCVADSIPPV
jgi:uncharacterized protein (TIGR00290 family)